MTCAKATPRVKCVPALGAMRQGCTLAIIDASVETRRLLRTAMVQ